MSGHWPTDKIVRCSKKVGTEISTIRHHKHINTHVSLDNAIMRELVIHQSDPVTLYLPSQSNIFIVSK